MFDIGKDIVVDESDNLGGSGPVESGLYDYVIKAAYVTTAKSGAVAINLELAAGKSKLRVTEYIKSGNAKGNKFTYTDKDGNEQPLPGFSKMNSLCLLAAGEELKDIDPEMKTLNLFNYELKKEVPTEVPVLMELLDQEITAGVLKIIEDKNVKNDAGMYVASGETREINEVDKWFRTRDRMTVSEIKAEATEAVFAGQWDEKNAGITKNKAKGAATGSGTSGTPAATGEAPAPKKKLFG